MARIHGRFRITRSTNYLKKSDYKKYKPLLVEDFYNICGYCGKNFSYISCPQQIDHFIPLSFCKSNGKPELEHEYGNLVYSCNICNRNKWHDWPTNSFTSHHNNIQGYVDPVSPEYDNHLFRNDDGSIVALTELGNYMVSKFKFDIRPTNIIWLVEQLEEKLLLLDEKIKKTGDENCLHEYYVVSEKLRNSFSILKTHREQL